MGNPIWFSYLAFAQAIRKNGSSMMFLKLRKNAIKEEFTMKKKLNCFGWKIGPVSETDYLAIKNKVTAIS